MEKQWFYLLPDTFLWCKKSNGLLYNSRTGVGFRFKNDKSIRQITEKLCNMENLYCIEIDDHDIKDQSMVGFVEKIQTIQAGNLIKPEHGKRSPIILPPLLNLQSDVKRLKKESPDLIGEHVLDYLHEVYIYVNYVESKSQLLKNLDYYRIENILESFLSSSLVHIHICGEDAFAYPNLMFLIDELCQINIKKSIHVKLGKLEKGVMVPDIFRVGQFQLVVEVDNDFIEEQIASISQRIDLKSVNTTWYFIVQNEKEYEFIESYIEKQNLHDAKIKPVYTGENLAFFEDYIYLKEEDLQNPGLSRREVFAHQALNTNDFGKLNIMPDGKVYANPYFSAIGTIEDDIRELIYKELTEGKSWLRIRDMEPCCECVYQWICPSPSNYELAIGKADLCHIKP